jgi:hypothetical protein
VDFGSEEDYIKLNNFGIRMWVSLVREKVSGLQLKSQFFSQPSNVEIHFFKKERVF